MFADMSDEANIAMIGIPANSPQDQYR